MCPEAIVTGGFLRDSKSIERVSIKGRVNVSSTGDITVDDEVAREQLKELMPAVSVLIEADGEGMVYLGKELVKDNVFIQYPNCVL